MDFECWFRDGGFASFIQNSALRIQNWSSVLSFDIMVANTRLIGRRRGAPDGLL
jgi:hypothetical protein